MNRSSLYIGVDVGTGSARAGLFDASGKMLAVDSIDIATWRPEVDFVEQSSADIWKACIGSVRKVLKESGAAPEQVRGLGFDATCSLVALGKGDRPVSVSPTGKNEHNVIVWMDHRAMEQTIRINAQAHKVLQFVGGQISPEMQTPKLLWLKKNLPNTWKRTTRFFDLPDFLTYRATGTDQRSLCSTVCKWTYLGHEKGSDGSIGRWEPSFFRQIGLGDLVDERFVRIGTRIRPMGEPVGSGLTQEAAEAFGLVPGTPVGTSIIDAHAGGIGLIGASVDNQKLSEEQDDLARLYLAAIQAIAHGTKHIIDRMNAFGFQLETIFGCGGGTKNPLFLQQHADITGCRILLPKEPEAVLLGSAVLGAVASGDFPGLLEAMGSMNRSGRIIQPVKGETARFHARKHAIFHRMYHDQVTYRRMIREEV